MTAPRGVGLSAFQHRSNLSTSYATHGAALRQTHLDALAAQLAAFKALLQSTARQHRAAIARDPAFRAEFARMCSVIGVDPLALAADGKDVDGGAGGKEANRKGKREGSAQFDMLVGVSVVEVCRERRDENGGLLGVQECRDLVRKRAGLEERQVEVLEYVADDQMLHSSLKLTCQNCREDIVRAVEMLEPLKGGFSIVMIGNKRVIRSVPKELSKDQSVVLEELQSSPYVTVALVQAKTGWDEARAVTVLEDLVSNSMVWICHEETGIQYWAPPPLDDGDMDVF